MLTFKFSTPRLAAAWALAVLPPAPVRPVVPERWAYSGDGNLEHGGCFIDISTWNLGYCDAVRVTDLESASGFDGAVLIEHYTINGTSDSERIRQAVRSCGDYRCGNGTGEPANIKVSLRCMIAEALLSYGFCDLDDSWDNYQTGSSEIVQTDPNGEITFDGWTANYLFDDTDELEAYIIDHHLRD